jgi:outer membrane protein assembly factor BamB
VGAVLSCSCASLWAADWPQYRGLDEGRSAETINPASLNAKRKPLWRIPTQNGFSSFAIADGKVFTQVDRDLDGSQRELCIALDADTGKELWYADIDVGEYPSGGDAGAKGNDGGDGPRSTPTIDDGLVYCYTQNLVLHCLDASTGKPVWSKDIVKEHAGRNISWNNAMSPVVDGDAVFIAGGGPGQSLLAIHKKTGEVIWKVEDELITHATPVVATILGERQVIFYLQKGLVSVSAKDGKALWRFSMPFQVSTAASPVVAGDLVYCSAGYGVGGAVCKIAKNGEDFTATEVWRLSGNKKVPSHWSTPVYRDGHLYGMFSFKEFGKGPLKCVELATGKIKWEQPGFGAGNVILAKDKLIALADDGRVVIVEASPKAYKQLAEVKAVEGKCWSTPALSDGHLYVRSTKEGACLDVGKRQ